MTNTLKLVLNSIMSLSKTETIVDLIVMILRRLAQRTKSEIDDKCVEVVAQMLYETIKLDPKKKLEDLEAKFK